VRRRYVVLTGAVMGGPAAILLEDCSFIDLVYLLRWRGAVRPWVFSSAGAAAAVARRWRRDDVVVVRVRP
jgi:hypothetical protein